jgi:DNA-binding transcriptional MocR family regulator
MSLTVTPDSKKEVGSYYFGIRREFAVGVIFGVALGVSCSKLSRLVFAVSQWYFDDSSGTTLLDHHPVERMSLAAKARRDPPLRSLLPLRFIPDMIWMAGGTPSPESFPIVRINVETKDGLKLDIKDPKLLTAAQQYMLDVTPGLGVVGYLPLMRWIQEFQQIQHSPKYNKWACAITCGNQDGFMKVFDAILDPGDTLLVDAPQFCFSVSAMADWTGARALTIEQLPVQSNGIDVHSLASLLADWHILRQGIRFPKALFCVPQMQNPTCTSHTPENIQAVYSVCKKYNLFIIEDDPYRYLSFGDALTSEDTALPGANSAQLPASFFSVDVDGRVIRLDSFSKWMGPGFRCGWITAEKKFLARLSMASGTMNILLLL